jgi:hypothetical protein
MIKQNKKGIEMSFAWMFAILVGVVIILLAIYAAVKIVGTEKKAKDSAIGKELSTLLNPIETNLESAKTSTITFAEDTRLYNSCDLYGNFGTQLISTATSSGIGNKWEKPGSPARLYNKYIFSSSILEGKNIYILSKPFYLPYKVGDFIIMWNDQDYCFVSPTNDVEEEVIGLGLKNINVSSSTKECPEHSIKVCFVGSGCDIDVSSNTVKRKGQKTVYYADTEGNEMLYAAIFSDPLLYECQLQRMMRRASELALLYASKSDFLSAKGCTSTALQSDLISYSNRTRIMNSSLEINSIASESSLLGDRNKQLSCNLF